MNNIAKITRVGAVIIATIASFLIQPPMISGTGYVGVNFNNVITFVAGFLTIFLFDKYKSTSNIKSKSIGLLVLFLVLVGSYQYAYVNYSMNCLDEVRCIISNAPLKKEVQIDYDYVFKKTHDREATIHQLFEGRLCSSVNLWDTNDVMIPYAGFILLYLAITIVFILLIVSISEIAFPDNTV